MALYNTSGKKIEKSAIMVYNEADIDVKAVNAWAQYQLPFNSVKNVVGDKFTLKDGSVSYTGNKLVKMTIHIARKNTTNGILYIHGSFDSDSYESATANKPNAIAIDIFKDRKTFNAWVSDSVSETITFSKGEGTYMLLEEI